MAISIFYNSSDIQSFTACQVVRSKYPESSLYDTKGLDTAGITAVIGTISATSQEKIFVLVDVGTNPPSGNLVAAQITALTGKLVGAPYDTAPIQIASSSGVAVNTTKNRALLAWENNNVYPGETAPTLVRILGQYQYKYLLFSSTATAGAASALTNSGVAMVVDSLKGKFLHITDGTGAGQIYPILTNSATVITIDGVFATTPDNTSVYQVEAFVNITEIEDSGTATGAGASTNTLADTGQAWTADEHIGKMCRIVGGTGVGEELLIVDNTATQLTVVQDWVATIDNTTEYEIVFFTEKGGDNQTAVSDTRATAGAAGSITNSAGSYIVNRYQGFTIEIISGTGAGQKRNIASNTATVFGVTENFSVTPNNTSVFIVYKEGTPWPYNRADQYLTLAIIPSKADESTATFDQFRAILGKQPEQQRLQSGGGEDLSLLNSWVEEGQTIVNYLYP